MPRLLLQFFLACALLVPGLAPVVAFAESAAESAAAPASDSPLVQAILAPAGREQAAAVRALVGLEDAAIIPALTAWRAGELFLVPLPDGTRVPATLSPASTSAPTAPLASIAISTGQPVVDPATGQPFLVAPGSLRPLDTSNLLRRAIRDVLEVAGVSDPSPTVRRDSIERIGLSRKTEHLPLLQARLEVEKIPTVRTALTTSIAFIQLGDESLDVRLAAIAALGEAHSLPAASVFKDRLALASSAPGAPTTVEAAALKKSLQAIEGHWARVNFAGNLFRGLSAGSVLLLIALGLAITFGLMGVINMAHGELMVVGAYATFVTQNIFASVFGMGTAGFGLYFLAALPVAFVSAALVGLLIERGVIQFLYKRPLESLLATWGVSLVLQQTFRVVFGPSNVQINAPSWLQGGTTLLDVAFAFNRLFVIGFAILVVFGVWLVLNRTPIGLLVRAVMQNRQMASCIGIKTTRVNMMTFAFGSGLAGLAGACMSQLGNVGPGLGQLHIIDSFMVVVSGGVGNILGTVVAALGIGTVDQVLQPILGAVMGKILVLFAIIFFLQFRPGGLFPTRSRSLD